MDSYLQLLTIISLIFAAFSLGAIGVDLISSKIYFERLDKQTWSQIIALACLIIMLSVSFIYQIVKYNQPCL